MEKILNYIKSQIALAKNNYQLWKFDQLNQKWTKFYKAIENYFSVRKQ